jgi:hypothetical protein
MISANMMEQYSGFHSPAGPGHDAHDSQDGKNPSGHLVHLVHPVSSSDPSRSSCPSVESSSGSPLSFSIPSADLELLARLPDAVRNDATTTLLLLRRIHSSRSKSAEARVIAQERHHQRGCSSESLLRKYYRYRNGCADFAPGDWRAIIDRAQAGPAFWNSDSAIGLPKPFIEFWKSLCERNQRKTAPARRELLRIWQTGKGIDPATGKTKFYKAFPGYPDWSPGSVFASVLSVPSVVSSDGLPPGWSQANLNRHAPSKFELAVARRGREAASAYRRKVFTTRAGLHVGEFYLFDDLEYDLLVNFPGNRIATRPLGLVALDLLSACAIGLGFKPVIIDPEGTKRKLKERDMLWLVADVLCAKGYRSDSFGTHLVVENGTAAIRPDFEQRILAATSEHVRVDRAGLSKVHLPGLFEGDSKGNPRFKAALESLINLIHNEGANLPAQTGMDRDHAPKELAGIQRYNAQLLKLADQLPSHRRELLQFPVMTYQQFCEVTLDIFRNINQRVDHELEGWEKCGHVVQEFFLSIPSCPSRPSVDFPSAESVKSVETRFSQAQWLALPARQRAALKPLVNSTCRQLSPQEVWNAGASQLQKLPEHALPILLGPDLGEERSVRSGYITIEDKELSSEPLRFPAFVAPGASSSVSASVLSVPSVVNHRETILQEGSKFLTYLNPHNPDRLILTDARGRYLGGLDRQHTPTRSDVQAVHRQLAQARHEEAERLAPVSARALPIVKARTEMHRHNLAIADRQPVTPEEIQSAQELRKRIQRDGKAATDDMLPSVGCNDPHVGSSVTLAPSTHEPPEASPSVLDDTLIDEMLP